MGGVKSKPKRVRSSRSTTFSSEFTFINTTPNYNNNYRYYTHSEPTAPVHTNINDNLVNIINTILSAQNNINNNTTDNNNNNNIENNTTTTTTNNEEKENNETDNNENNNNNNNKKIKKKHTMKDHFGDEVLIIDAGSMVIDVEDRFSRSTGYVVARILSLLSLRELCNVQQVSHFWYSAGRDNEIWKSILLRDSAAWESSSRGLVNTLKGEGVPVKWKKIAREECSHLNCWKCKKKFQKCKNSAVACMYHPQGRELIEDKIGAPSGVYWTCCLNRSKFSPGCVIGYHSEYDWAKEEKGKGKRDNNNNNNVYRGIDRARRVSL